MKKDSLSCLSCSHCRKHQLMLSSFAHLSKKRNTSCRTFYWGVSEHHNPYINKLSTSTKTRLSKKLLSKRSSQQPRKLLSKQLSQQPRKKYYVNISLEGESRTLSIKYKYGLQFVTLFLFLAIGPLKKEHGKNLEGERETSCIDFNFRELEFHYCRFSKMDM